ncbi:hypothetical protein [Nocardia australiensis]|uniref:hypothetical protein n=1 Tax=Nocardia australiensis TaxID=2887191 RepID=UPI001D134C78|nr:hypothetical protein [Nocardia australiensis]
MTPEQDAVLRDIQVQLRGPGLVGWPQLGTDTQGHARSLVDGLAAALDRIDALEHESSALRSQIDELRTEISELEATTAELSERTQRLDGPHWPWPLSLIEGPATLVGEQLARLESLLPELPGLPGHRDSGCALMANERTTEPGSGVPTSHDR